LRFRTDSSNNDPSFLRNRIRLELLPLLESYNPSIVSRLADTAAIMAADEELMAECVARCWPGVGIREHDGVTVNCTKLREEPSGMRLRIYRHALLLLTGHLRRISFRHLQAIDSLVVSGPSNGRLDLPGTLSVLRSYETARFVSDHDRAIEGHKPFELAIPGHGSYDLPCGGRVVIAPAGAGDSERQGSRFSLTVSLLELPFPWTVRTFRPGDRLVPSGMTGRKKVKDLFIDEKVPRSLRSAVPLVFSGDTLFWVAGVRTAASSTAFAEDSASARIEFLEFPYGPAILG
jgi:tRNA(Ile)-lysidine synthase